MKTTVRTLATGPGLAPASAPALTQHLTNAGARCTGQPGTTGYVGTGKLGNQRGTLPHAGALRTDGFLANSGTLDRRSGTVEMHGDLTNVRTVGPGTGIAIADATANTGATTNILHFGNAKPASGEGIGSKRTGGGNRHGRGHAATISNFFGCR